MNKVDIDYLNRVKVALRTCGIGLEIDQLYVMLNIVQAVDDEQEELTLDRIMKVIEGSGESLKKFADAEKSAEK